MRAIHVTIDFGNTEKAIEYERHINDSGGQAVATRWKDRVTFTVDRLDGDTASMVTRQASLALTDAVLYTR